ncbi:hypothetical protein QTP86_020574 [Hemibagrus guttatus]|nr:hypothetical protein QTP86_020574 [Hemibagrus guttatus]
MADRGLEKADIGALSTEQQDKLRHFKTGFVMSVACPDCLQHFTSYFVYKLVTKNTCICSHAFSSITLKARLHL